MFISRKRYKALTRRIEALEREHKALAEMRNDITGILFGFAEDIAAVQEAIAEITEDADALKEERDFNRRFQDGLNNIFSYTGGINERRNG
jgi:uncharacterized protein (UPF0335 family)